MTMRTQIAHQMFKNTSIYISDSNSFHRNRLLVQLWKGALLKTFRFVLNYFHFWAVTKKMMSQISLSMADVEQITTDSARR